jgi:hypothetical protein
MDLSKAEVLLAAISSIIRQTLLVILKQGLLAHWQDSASSESYIRKE